MKQKVQVKKRAKGNSLQDYVAMQARAAKRLDDHIKSNISNAMFNNAAKGVIYEAKN